MNSRQISCFLEAARCGSFTTAAKRLYVSQPTFSRCIAQLEQELGLVLFDRSAFRGTGLTASGKVMAEAFEQTQAQIDAALAHAHALERERTLRLSLGLLEGQLLDDSLADSFSRLRQSYPNLHVHITRNTYQVLMQRLRDGKLDLVCMPAWQLEGVPGLQVVPHRQLDTVLVAPKRLVGELTPGTHALAEFAQLPFVSVDEGESRHVLHLMEELFAAAHIDPPIVLVSSLEEQIQLVEMGEGAILINPYNHICYSPTVCCVRVAELQPQPFALAWRKDDASEGLSLLLAQLRLDGNS